MRNTSIMLIIGAGCILVGFMVLPFFTVQADDTNTQIVSKGADYLYGLGSDTISYVSLGYWLMPVSAFVALILAIFVQRNVVPALYGQLALALPLSAQVVLFLEFMQSIEETTLGILPQVGIGYALNLIGLFVVLIACIRIAIGVEYAFVNK